MHTSGLVFLFTFLSIAFSLPQLYMYLRFYGEEGLQVANHFVDNHHLHPDNHHFPTAEDLEEQLIWRTPQLIFFSIHLSMVLIIFLLSCFSDQRPLGERGNRIADLTTIASSALKNDHFSECNNNGNSNGFIISRACPNKKESLTEKPKNQRGSMTTATSGFNGLESAHYHPAAQTTTTTTQPSRKNSSLKMMTTSTMTLSPPPPPFINTSKRLSIAPEAPQKESPELRASFLSQLTFWWFTPLAIHGYRKSLTMDDLWKLNREDTTAYIAPRADKQWIRQVKFRDDKGKGSKKLPSSVFNVDDEYEFPSIESLKLSRAEIARLLASPKRPSVVRCLYKTFQLAIWQGVFFKFLQDMVQFISPFLLK